MCDYSLQTVRSRPARVGDKLTTHHFNTGTIGFAAPEDANTAVCVLPGTELAFAKPVMRSPRVLFGWKANLASRSLRGSGDRMRARSSSFHYLNI